MQPFRAKISCFVRLVLWGGFVFEELLYGVRGKFRTQRPELRAESGEVLPTYRWVVGTEETGSGSVPR